jgi:signal transduction histidine kinase
VTRPKITRARTRIALSGAALSALFLAIIALGTRTVVRSLTFADIDDELYTLSIALGSSFELEGLVESKRDTLKAGLEANAFEFRLANHSAILFSGDIPVAASGNLLSQQLPGGIAPYKDRPEVPYTATEPYSGQRRTCRFLVTHLQQKAKGATLVVFRWIGPSLRNLARLDQALIAFVLIGFVGTAAILKSAVGRAIAPVEEITRRTKEMEATDLSRRVPIAGGDEFRRLASVINSLLDRLERAFLAQRRLIADAAHELKTPTAILVGEAQEAQRAEATDLERRESLTTIERVARGLAREVDSLLLLARTDPALPAERVLCDLSVLAEEAVAGNAPIGAARGVRLVLERDGPASLYGDRAALVRVASNLISNAVLYTNPESPVEVEVGSRPDQVFLEVRDRGPGVALENRARIFERFVRLEDARNHHPEGSGLGLAIVEQVVRSHGGRVEIEDREGGGTVFRVVLPAAIASA